MSGMCMDQCFYNLNSKIVLSLFCSIGTECLKVWGYQYWCAFALTDLGSYRQRNCKMVGERNQLKQKMEFQEQKAIEADSDDIWSLNKSSLKINAKRTMHKHW